MGTATSVLLTHHQGCIAHLVSLSRGTQRGPSREGGNTGDMQRPRESRGAEKGAADHSCFPGRWLSMERCHNSQSPRARDRRDSQFLHGGCHPWDWI